MPNSHSSPITRVSERPLAAASQKRSQLVPTEKIATRAYEKYLGRACVDGLDVDDWLTAEQELIVESHRQ